ncbi:MAG TPA: hypothetical protein PLP17_05490, partial [Oligoflexia bacterium]|nr:hypothetical protein [Oligoflexia bacterium]
GGSSQGAEAAEQNVNSGQSSVAARAENTGQAGNAPGPDTIQAAVQPRRSSSQGQIPETQTAQAGVSGIAQTAQPLPPSNGERLADMRLPEPLDRAELRMPEPPQPHRASSSYTPPNFEMKPFSPQASAGADPFERMDDLQQLAQFCAETLDKERRSQGSNPWQEAHAGGTSFLDNTLAALEQARALDLGHPPVQNKTNQDNSMEWREKLWQASGKLSEAQQALEKAIQEAEQHLSNNAGKLSPDDESLFVEHIRDLRVMQDYLIVVISQIGVCDYAGVYGDVHVETDPERLAKFREAYSDKTSELYKMLHEMFWPDVNQAQLAEAIQTVRELKRLRLQDLKTAADHALLSTDPAGHQLETGRKSLFHFASYQSSLGGPQDLEAMGEMLQTAERAIGDPAFTAQVSERKTARIMTAVRELAYKQVHDGAADSAPSSVRQPGITLDDYLREVLDEETYNENYVPDLMKALADNPTEETAQAAISALEPIVRQAAVRETETQTADAAIAIAAAQKRVAEEALDGQLESLQQRTDRMCADFVRFSRGPSQPEDAAASRAEVAIQAIDAELAAQERLAEKGPRTQSRRQLLLAQRQNIQLAVSQHQRGLVGPSAAAPESTPQLPERRTTKKRLGRDYTLNPEDLLKDLGGVE